MFSQDEFIAASRDFVCVRLESYESVENQELIRGLLRGAFANTAFCILAPDGKTPLSQSGRSPSALLGRRGGPSGDPEAVIQVLRDLSASYSLKGTMREATMQDFNSTRQALNVASGDQRLLLLTVGGPSEQEKARQTLQGVLNDEDMVGRFHHDFADGKIDADWVDLMEGEKLQKGYFLIQPDSFGLKGKVLAEFPFSATSDEIKALSKTGNTFFARSEKRKVYREHVSEGRRKGIHFENGMPYGEDRDGDGVIDQKRGRGRR